MRTKRLITLALLAAIVTMARAQFVSLQSNQEIVTQEMKPEKPKRPRTYQWFIKAGFSIDDLAGAKGVDATSKGYDVSFGILKPTNNEFLFWGLEIGAISLGGFYDGYLKVNKQSAFFFSPSIGYRIIDSGKLRIAPYIGPYVSYTLNTLKDYYDGNGWIANDSKLSGGINVGVGLWFGKSFCVDLHFRRALLRNMEEEYNGDKHNAFLQKIVFGVGLAF